MEESKSPDRNIYIYIPHPLCDPYVDTAADRLDAAFRCQMCAIGLALRGKNVDRTFWSKGPLGWNQTKHLELVRF